MNIKNIIFTLAALAFTALSAWQGPTVAGAIAGSLVAICVLVLSLHVVPPKAVEYIEDLEDALKSNAPDVAAKVVKRTDDGPKGGAIATMLVLIGVACCVVANTTACTAQQANAIVHDVSPAGACIVNALAEGGASDPMLIVAECAGTAIADVVQVIEDLLANPAQASDAGAVGASSHERYLREMLTKAHALLAAGKLAAAK